MISMQGKELSRKYYEAFGKDMISTLFPDYEGRIAVGIAGNGSDCFGFDDGISRDHDFGVGFCMWLTDEDYGKAGFELQKAYNTLPDEFLGVKKLKTNPSGINHFGVMRTSDFYISTIGTPYAPKDCGQWLATDDCYFATAVNGCVFRDDLGEFSAIRNSILTDMPEDVRLKKISARAIRMAQSGQYNFARCLSHGEKGAAALALGEFVKETASLIYLLNGKFCPFYKWALRGIKELAEFSHLSEELTELLTSPTDSSQIDKIEKICGEFAGYFRKNGLSDCPDNFLEPHAYQIRDRIRNPILRNAHIMEG